MTLSITALCHCPKCCYAKYRNLIIVMLNVIMLNVVMLIVVALISEIDESDIFELSLVVS